MQKAEPFPPKVFSRLVLGGNLGYLTEFDVSGIGPQPKFKSSILIPKIY